MDELITLSCPSCGGQLRLEPNTTTYTCYYCGQQHRLRVEDLEAYGRCPICHRNDKVEKVKAIIHKGDKLSTRLAPPENPEKSYIYEPKAKPQPLLKPNPGREKIRSKYSNRALLCLFVSLVFLVLFVVMVIKDPDRAYQIWYLLLSFFGLILAIVYFIKGKKEECAG